MTVTKINEVLAALTRAKSDYQALLKRTSYCSSNALLARLKIQSLGDEFSTLLAAYGSCNVPNTISDIESADCLGFTSKLK